MYLNDLEWRAIERMSSVVGGSTVGAMLYTLDRDEQHAAVTEFIQHELDGAQENVALLHQQGSQHAYVLREQGAS